MATATTSAPTAIDTTPGTKAYALAVQYKAELTPRLPADTLTNLAADLTTLGASPNGSPVEVSSAPPPPPLSEAMSSALTLLTAVHDAIRGAKPPAEVRKVYGVSAKTSDRDAAAIIATGEKIVARAHTAPKEALGLGILPPDITALEKALADLAAAETLAKGKSKGSTNGKERHAAAMRMDAAVARIAGAGALAFATNATVRAEFAGLKTSKKA